MARCRAAMERQRVDALVVYSAGYTVGGYEWVRYFANYVDAAPLWASETWMIVPAQDDPTLFVTWPQMVERAQRSSPVADVRVIDVWRQEEGERHELVAPALAACLAEHGLSRSRVAFGHGGRGGSWMGYTPASVIAAVERACREATLVDGSALLWDLTRVKTEYDLAMLRRVAEMNCAGLGAALEGLAEGTSECELLAAKLRRVAELGAEIADPEHAQLAAIHPHGLRPFYVTNYRFRAGDMFVVDSGCSAGGYESDIARTAVIGTPNRRQRRAYRAGMAIAEALEAALRPGVTARRLWEIKEAEAERAGFTRTMPTAGHGVGISKHEAPDLAPWDDTAIEENMVINLEPGLLDPPEACFVFEETYIVRAEGAERITPLSSELFIG